MVILKNEEKIEGYLLSALASIKNNDALYKDFEKVLIDNELYFHSLSVAKLATALALSYELGSEETQEICLAGMLHDIGKLKIPRSILYKPDRLTSDEFEVVKKHATYSYEICSEKGVSQNVLLMILRHHERINGNGYPLGIKNDLELREQIIAVADVFSALIENRVYHSAKSVSQALDYISTFKDLNSDLLIQLSSLVKD